MSPEVCCTMNLRLSHIILDIVTSLPVIRSLFYIEQNVRSAFENTVALVLRLTGVRNDGDE